ncbi:ABC transporter permease [Pseudooceanicola sp. CBS1P-1]|uniref:FtsX-like permease family protein n=1 Tax=Pseudooceanicola albus TaxID=2692189 RepID=A0A6L7G8B6_9RHOB|nr:MULTISPECIES: ABC transporter permease [Pseudooceanicola]MBT9386245.1 ABC transporter permease [Pseudooceanicola endophyticus]MXN20295.1 FtsX-like permease family protein [Pseudooceanicola albus]
MRLTPSMLLRQNLTRNLTRSVLMILCIGTAFFLFGLLSSFRAGFEGSEARADRLVVSSKVGGNETLPLAYLQDLKAMPGVAAVTHITRLRAYRSADPRDILGANAVDPESYARVYADTYRFTPALMQALADNRTGVLVGRSLAEREGWKTGDRISLTSFVHPNAQGMSWGFSVAGIFDGAEPTVDTNFLLLRSDYFNTALVRGKDQVNLFGILPAPGTDPDALIQRIDQRFANSSAQTRTQSETAYMGAFLEQFADISTIVQLVSAVAFATILLITANTMIFAIRERTREIGVLKVLGFAGPAVMGLVLAETLVLFLLGLALGLGATAAVLPLLGGALSSIVPELYLTPRAVASAVVIAAVLALLTAAGPALKALRLPVASALKQR